MHGRAASMDRSDRGAAAFLRFHHWYCGYFTCAIDRWMRPELQLAPSTMKSQQVSRSQLTRRILSIADFGLVMNRHCERSMHYFAENVLH